MGKTKWKQTDDYLRYKMEHLTFLIKIKEKHPNWDVFVSSRVFWRLGKLKERYSDIAVKMSGYKERWERILNLIGMEEMNKIFFKLKKKRCK